MARAARSDRSTIRNRARADGILGRMRALTGRHPHQYDRATRRSIERADNVRVMDPTMLAAREAHILAWDKAHATQTCLD